MGLLFDIKRCALHDGPGIRTTLFFKGCPLACPWCHNPEGIAQGFEFMWSKERCISCKTCQQLCPKGAISFSGQRLVIDTKTCDLCQLCVDECPSQALELVGKEMTVTEVMKEIKKDIIFYDESGGGVTFSGGEPLMQPDFLYHLLKACKNEGIHTAVDTCGFSPSDILLKINEVVDLFLYDVKVIDDKSHRRYTGVSNKIILKNLKMLSDVTQNICVRFPVIPGVNDDEKLVRDLRDFISSLKVEEVSILPYHKAGIEKGQRLKPSRNSFKGDIPSTETISTIKNILKESGLTITTGG